MNTTFLNTQRKLKLIAIFYNHARVNFLIFQKSKLKKIEELILTQELFENLVLYFTYGWLVKVISLLV